jgi:hypothetical protein
MSLQNENQSTHDSLWPHLNVLTKSYDGRKAMEHSSNWCWQSRWCRSLQREEDRCRELSVWATKLLPQEVVWSVPGRTHLQQKPKYVQTLIIS